MLFRSDGSNNRIRRVRETAKSCSINGACYSALLANPGDACQVCDAGKSTSTWTVKADTAVCVDGDFCTAGDTCTNGHFMHIFRDEEELRTEIAGADLSLLELNWPDGYAVLS